MTEPDKTENPAAEPDSGAEPAKPEKSAFTLKAIVLGLVGVVLINALADFNDEHLKSTLLVGNHLPIGVYFIILFLAVVWNPVCKLVSNRLVLNTRELVLVLCLMLVGAWTPTSGFYRYFQKQLILPWFKASAHKTWDQYQVLDNLPRKLFPLEADKKDPMYDSVYTGFLTGLGNEHIWPWSKELTRPPVDPTTGKAIAGQSIWGAWLRPMIYWGPLLICFSVTVLALSLLVHRQWAHHEQLSYPLAQISLAIISREKERKLPDIFYSRLFQWGMGVVLMLHMLRLASAWFGESTFPDIKLVWNMRVQDLFPTLLKSGAPFWYLANVRVFFTIIGVAYFLPSAMGLSMGICNIVLAVILCQLYLARGVPASGENLEMSRAGAYFGYALILLYTGRNYFAAVLRKAFCFWKSSNVDPASVLAARVLLVGFAGFVLVLSWMGLAPLVALLFGGTTMLLFLVFTRVVCETGIPFLQAYWMPGIVLAKVFGFAAIGPRALSFTYWMSTILCQDPRECMMPYVATSLKVADDSGVQTSKIASMALIAVMLALIVGFGAKLANTYAYGAAEDGWSFNGVPVNDFNRVANAIAFMDNTGELEAARSASTWRKLSLVSMNNDVMVWLAFGFLGVLLLSMLRFRFSWWPLHPVLMVIWGTFPLGMTMYSFLIGWMIKELIVKFGGGKVYRDLKPLFIGLIVGELLAMIIGITIAFTYYGLTGIKPPGFRVLPG